MLIDDFARKHKLCEYGLSQLKLNENRELRDMWEDRNLPAAGTVLFWILSRAQVDRRKLIRCAAECAEEVVPHLGANQAQGRQFLAAVAAWCDGSGDRDAVDEGTRTAVVHAKEAKRGGRDVEMLAWSSLSQLGRSVRNLNSTSGMAGAVASTIEAAGGAADACHSRMADALRRTFEWSEIDAAIQADRPSPRPRRPTPEEISERTQNLSRNLEQLVSSFQAAAANLQAAFSSLGTTPEKVQTFVRSGRLGDKNTRLIQEELAKLLADEERAAAASTPAAAAPRRPRMTV